MSGAIQTAVEARTTSIPPPDGAAINIALVNNMPDLALLETERQYRDLAEAAAAESGLRVTISLFCLDGIARSEHARARMRGRYGNVEDLRGSAPDAVIITGAEPRAGALTQEPYWCALTQVLEWADANTRSVMLSCLAAHAAILHFDGVERTPLTHKCTGVFDVEKTTDHVLTSGMPRHWRAVHSRRNDAPEAGLRARGYTVLGQTDGVGPHLFVKQRSSLLVCFQGHPEYGTDTLMLEYRRDVGRFLRGEQDHYPELPHEYFDAESERRLSAFRAAAERRRTDFAGFPRDLAIRSRASTWLPAARCVFRNWLQIIHARKSRERASRAAVGA